MFGKIKIAPSILSGNFLNLDQSLEQIKEGADWVHVDVMDGHFVPNITMGIPLVKQINEQTDLFIDAHLMVSNPVDQIPWFIDAGADMITFHVEAATSEQIEAMINLAHEKNIQIGLAIKPSTDISYVYPYISLVDMILVMSVEPGFSGQSYIEGCEDRVALVVQKAKEEGVSPLIQVDGGINSKTIALVAASGADIFVCGNAFYKSDDPSKSGLELKSIALKAQNNSR